MATEIEERVNRLKKQLFLAQNQISLKNEYIDKLKTENEELTNDINNLNETIDEMEQQIAEDLGD